jgi:hypothetical protein
VAWLSPKSSVSACHKFGWKDSKGIVTAVRVCGRSGGSVAKGMKKISDNGYRFPPEIQQAIWLYPRFTLSFHDAEDLLAEPRQPCLWHAPETWRRDHRRHASVSDVADLIRAAVATLLRLSQDDSGSSLRCQVPDFKEMLPGD